MSPKPKKKIAKRTPKKTAKKKATARKSARRSVPKRKNSGKPMSMPQELSAGVWSARIQARLKQWDEAKVAERLWAKDGTLWVADPEKMRQTPDLLNRLNWLDAPQLMSGRWSELADFARSLSVDGIKQVVLLGMGGSSLAPEVFAAVFGSQRKYPKLWVLDSTHPEAILPLAANLDLNQTLFCVSSKSGSTLETHSFYEYFYSLCEKITNRPGEHFIAITDPGSKMEQIAREKGFRRIFSSPPNVGGRFSALTEFGLVPAALIGVDGPKLLKSALAMTKISGPKVSASQNPALILGAALGELALAGRNKLTLLASPEIEHFGVWIEQLVAESTGKLGKGILPVAQEELGPNKVYGKDRCFVYTRLEGGKNTGLDKTVKQLQKAGHPVLRIALPEKYDLGGEFVRWELATAMAGVVLGINPFDQPDVESAKVKARELMQAYQVSGQLPVSTPQVQDQDLACFGTVAPGKKSVTDAVCQWLKLRRPGDYIALMAYVPQSAAWEKQLLTWATALRDLTQLAVTVGFGPRFLHSTGQLHKGDGNQGLCLQITQELGMDAAVPNAPYTFGVIVTAQAQGDMQALTDKGRRVLRVHLKTKTSTKALGKILTGK